MNKLFLLVLLLVIPVLCFGKTITGFLKTIDEQPIEYANVVLLAQTDSTFLTGAISREDGSFALALSRQSTTPCLVQITCIGYKTLFHPVNADHIGTLTLEEDAQMLNEVVVKGNLPVTRLKGNALITNVEGSLLEKTGTAQNLLDYIPGVTSQRGSLQVLGRGAPVVYINNRLVRDASELEQLSADNIKSVEVITHPGARYAASVNAVIRIQTKKAVGDGFGFSNRAYAGYDRKWTLLNQLNLNYRQGGWDIFGMLYLNSNENWSKFTLTQDTYLENHFRQIVKADGGNRNKNLIADFGMNYVVNANHSMGFKYRYDRTPRGIHSGHYNFEITENDAPYEQSVVFTSWNGRSTEQSVNLYYNGKVNDWSIDFNTDLLWIGEDQNQVSNEQTTSSSGTTDQEVTTFSDISNRLYASKLMLSHPLFGGELAFGGELSLTERASDYRNPQGILNDDNSEIKENNTAAFAEYSRELGKFQLQAGLRYEHVAFNYYEEDTKQDDQSKTYDNLFPSLSIGTQLGKVQMQLGYTQDISRPNFWSLRNYVFYANRYTYETGNPFLLPSIAHNVSLMAVYRWWQFSASYQHRKDDSMLTTVSYSDDDPNIVLFKPINAPAYDVAQLQVSASPTVGLWSPRFTLLARKQWYETESPEGNINLNRPRIFFRWQNSFKLPAGFLFGLNGHWCSKFDSMNSRINRSNWGISTSLYKGFLNNRLTFQLNGYDIFLTERSSRMSYNGSVYTVQKVEVPNTRSVSLTVRYSFNQARNKYKGTGAGESQKNRL